MFTTTTKENPMPEIDCMEAAHAEAELEMDLRPWTADQQATQECLADDYAAEEYAEAFLLGPIAAANYRATRARIARAAAQARTQK
jgi:hypothetical protein